MNKKYGVVFGMLTLGLAALGTPAVRAQSRAESNGAGGAVLASATSSASAAPASSASSPADLDRRIEQLEEELVSLRTEMTARKEAEATAAIAPAPAPAAAPQDKPADKTTIASLLGPTSVSGFVDTYYQTNLNHPNGSTPNFYPGAGFRAFDFRDKSINLNMIELILDKAPDAGGPAGRTGYHVSLGYGDAMNVVNSLDPGSNGNTGTSAFFSQAQFLKEAYFSYLAPIGKGGVQFDVGKFVTPMGAEVIESKDNWNYSRGLLFTWAIPFYHFGVRGKYNFNSKYNVTGYVMNGWNNVVDNNSGKTYGFSFVGTPTKTTGFTINYLAGPETSAGAFGFTNSSETVPVNVNSVWRQMWDVVGTYNPTGKLSLMANFDYGRGDRTVTNSETNPFTLSPPVYWTGGAGYAKYAIDANDYLAARYEYFEDHDGFEMSTVPTPAPFFTGIPIHTHFDEITATYQRTVLTHLLTRLEYRRDMASRPVFFKSIFATGVKNQDTISLGLIFLFDSRDAK